VVPSKIHRPLNGLRTVPGPAGVGPERRRRHIHKAQIRQRTIAQLRWHAQPDHIRQRLAHRIMHISRFINPASKRRRCDNPNNRQKTHAKLSK
jgi:hypothetical protein